LISKRRQFAVINEEAGRTERRTVLAAFANR